MKSFETPKHSAENQESEKKPKKKLKKSLLAALALYTAPPSDTPQPNNESFDQRSIATEQLKEDGITESQREAYKPGVSEFFEKAINPFDYSREDGVPATLTEDVRRLAEQIVDSSDKEATREALDKDQVDAREDAWRMYLGLPQKNETFGISDFKPEKSSDDRYYYKINNFLQRYAEINGYTEENALFYLLLAAREPGYKIRMPYGTQPSSKTDPSKVMGRFTLTKGQDEKGHYISYYDKWNLEGSIEGEDGLIGKPFEIYDRIYYDPKILEFSE